MFLDFFKAPCSVEISGGICPATVHHIQEYWNLQLHCCKNLKSHSLQYLSHVSFLKEMCAEILSEPNNFGCCAALKQTF